MWEIIKKFIQENKININWNDEDKKIPGFWNYKYISIDNRILIFYFLPKLNHISKEYFYELNYENNNILVKDKNNKKLIEYYTKGNKSFLKPINLKELIDNYNNLNNCDIRAIFFGENVRYHKGKFEKTVFPIISLNNDAWKEYFIKYIL